jgi:hypothetical protein
VNDVQIDFLSKQSKRKHKIHHIFVEMLDKSRVVMLAVVDFILFWHRFYTSLQVI